MHEKAFPIYVQAKEATEFEAVHSIPKAAQDVSPQKSSVHLFLWHSDVFLFWSDRISAGLTCVW